MLRLAISHFSKPGGYSNVFFCSTSSRSIEIRDVKSAIGVKVWDQVIERFEALGFSNKQATKVLLSNPSVAKVSDASMQQHVDSVQSLGFKTTELKDIIIEEPRVLLSEPRVMRNNYLNLLNQLGNCDGRIAAQFSPNTLIENQLVTNEKIAYCTLEMCLPKQMIAKSKILKCDLRLMRTRHSFAYRSGYYKKVNPKNKEALAENPKISELLFSSNEKFLSICKGLTLEEYVIFESIIAQEENTFKDEDDTDTEYSE